MKRAIALGALIVTVLITGTVVSRSLREIPAGRGVAGNVFVHNMEWRINQQRDNRGLVHLQLDSVLNRAAQAHSIDMRNRGYFSHDPPGSTFAKRIYRYAHRRLMAEVLYTGNDLTTGIAVAAWMRSATHRRVILNRELRRFGVGLARRGGQAWVTLDFST